MSAQAIIDLIRRAPLSFQWTVQHLAAATTADVHIDDRTAVGTVDHVLHGPADFQTLQGQSITVQLAAGLDPLPVGGSAAFFVEGLTYGDSLAVTELGRLPVDEEEPHLTRGFGAGPSSFAPLERQASDARLREHAAEADAVVMGRVVGVEKAVPSTGSEHDPDWWAATVAVGHAEKGDVTGEVKVLYPNSLDVRWRAAPKPKASQPGLWLLHRTTGALADVAPYEIVHPEDLRPEQTMDSLRSNGG